MKQTVEAEMAEMRKKVEPSWGPFWKALFFNNFRLYLPGSTGRKKRIFINRPLYGMPGKKNRDLIAHIDLIIKEHGLDPAKLARLQPDRIVKRIPPRFSEKKAKIADKARIGVHPIFCASSSATPF